MALYDPSSWPNANVMGKDFVAVTHIKVVIIHKQVGWEHADLVITIGQAFDEVYSNRQLKFEHYLYDNHFTPKSYLQNQEHSKLSLKILIQTHSENRDTTRSIQCPGQSSMFGPRSMKTQFSPKPNKH